MTSGIDFSGRCAGRLLAACGALALLIGTEASARVWQVDQRHRAASDTGPGTVEQPLLTVAKAASLAQPGDTVRIAAGVYREEIAIARAGTNEQPIVFEAVEPGTAIITGADRLNHWRREQGERPIYSHGWPHDFFINQGLKGLAARTHGGKKPPEEPKLAEQLFAAGRPLRQVLAEDALAEGKFYVDWDADRLYAWLPQGEDPRTVPMEGSTRQYLFAPKNWFTLAREGRLAEAGYVTLRGLVFRYAANWAQRGMVITATGWRVENCTFQWANGPGLSVAGDNVVVTGCIAEDNGQMGIGGSNSRGTLLSDSIIRRNNWKGYNPSWEAGGGKWSHTDGLRIERVTSYENVGQGIWLDIENRNFDITGCTVYDNRGLDNDAQASGIMVEISPGPGRIENNICIDNTGPGIRIAESQKVVVRENLLVGNSSGVEWRDIPDREYPVYDVVVCRNRFKGWRGAAVNATRGTWDAGSVEAKKLVLDQNTYDISAGAKILLWGPQPYASLEALRRDLGFERHGQVAPVAVASSGPLRGDGPKKP